MYPISQLYEQYLQERARQWVVKVDIAGTTYGMDTIVDFYVENNLTSSDDFEIGMAIPSKLVLRLKTENVIPSNARVMPYIALNLPEEYEGNAGVAWQDNEDTWATADYLWNGAVTEWLPLGEFFVDKRERINDVWEFVCYDKLVYADVPYISQLSYPATQKQVWDEICTRLGYTYDSSVVIGSYTLPVAPTGYSCRQVMAYIAGANGASVYVGKDGMIKFRRYSASDIPAVELTEADYITVKETGPAKTYTKVVVVYDTDEGLAYEAGSGDENHTLYVECPFGTQQIANSLLVQLQGFSFVPIQMDARGYPQIEVGDRIRYGRLAPELTWGGADVAWNEADFSWTGTYTGGESLALNMIFGFKGGLSLSIEAPAKSEQESEFGVDGSLTAAINRLNRNSVKKGKTYYGLTITDDEGLVVERSDHKSKITLNSDVQRWEVDGIPKLEYDALANKLKFTGDIVMEGGSISWSNVNAPDIDDIPNLSGRLTYIGPTGIYSGTIKTDQLIAGSAKISSALIDTIKANQIVVGDNGEKIGDGLIASAANWNGKTTLLLPTGIYTGTIEANQINAASLSAISANLGTVTAGHIQGVTISGGVITGSLIQGATIQTSPSGRRIVLSDAFRSYDSNNVVRISIEDFPGYNYHQLQFFGEDSIRTGVISGTAGQFNFVTFNNAIMVFKGTPIVIDADTSYINFSNVPIYGLRVSINDVIDLNTRLQNIETNIVNLWNALDGKASKGALSGMTGPFNGGIPIGTNIQTTTGVVTWAGIPAHGHVQT